MYFFYRLANRWLTLCCDSLKIRRFLIGGVPERPKGTDCKSVGTAFEGSNPSPSTSLNYSKFFLSLDNKQLDGFLFCGCSLMVELQPSKLTTWVRFPSPAPNLIVSILIKNIFKLKGIFHIVTVFAHMAQSVERILGKDEVTSSILVMGTIFL